MKYSRLTRYYLLACAGVLLASIYPIMMGIYAVGEMVKNGAIPKNSFPKYIIPYTPIALALVFGVGMMPVFRRLFKRFDFAAAAISASGVFYLFERLMETKLKVEEVYLESWQMALCYIPPDQFKTRVWEAVDILLGGYSPAFKLHFYAISLVIIISTLNWIYSFAKLIFTGDNSRKKALIIQAITSAAFLGMCIWACFTSFYRTGELTVSALSAVLMTTFFALMGITMGAFACSLTLGKPKPLSTLMPALVSALITLLMYIGEMILLNGNLYRFGKGILFEGIPYIALAPIDIVIILFAGCAAGVICKLLNRA